MFKDITGREFHSLVVMYPLNIKDKKGYMMWHCRCNCGTEVDYSYNELMYGNVKSCGCLRRVHGKKLSTHLTHVGGTTLNLLQDQKKEASRNSTGVRGVYLSHGKYVVKMVFQQKVYYLGIYEELEQAAEVRKRAEELVHQSAVEYYARWNERAAEDSTWASENPVQIYVEQDAGRELRISFHPVLS